MSKYTFESIEYANQGKIRTFVTSIQSSNFHWHYEYELIVVLKGTILVRVDTGVFSMNPGDLILVNSRVIHSISCKSETNLCGIIQLDPRLFQNGKEDTSYYQFYLNSVLDELPPKCGYGPLVKRACKILLCTLRESDIGDFRMRAEVYGIIADFMEEIEYDRTMKVSQLDANAELLMQIIEYMQEHLTSKNITEALCKKFAMGEKTLYRFFKNNIDVSVKEFSDELKVEKAKQFLTDTDLSMNIIFDECGFGSEKTFYRVFQKITGQTPNRYRQDGILKQAENKQIKGYLDFEKYEAESILLEILEEL